MADRWTASDRVRRSLVCVLCIAGVLWFPHSLERTLRLGYDFPIYLAGPGHPGWLYRDWLSFVFEPFRALPYAWAFGAWYVLCLGAWLRLVYLVSGSKAGVVVAVASTYPALLSLELGQISPILAWLCLTPWGCLLAGLVKPWCLGFLVLHAVRYGVTEARRRRRGIAEKGTSAV
jgi:hypothetical protein